MKAVYLLLIFSIFLKNCQCVCNFIPTNCGFNEYQYDIDDKNGQFCICYEEKASFFSYCKELSCTDNKCADIWNYLNLGNYPATEYACPKLNTKQYRCVFKDDNSGCETKYCASLKENCDQLDYCVHDGDSCKVNDCRGFYTQNDCTSITLNDNNVIHCKWENDLCQCEPDGKNGCKREKLKCLDNSLYIYDKVTCENLDVSTEGYKCLNNGKECIEVNSCDSIKNTEYETNSENLKKLCDLFDNCEPYEKGCRDKYTPTKTIPRTGFIYIVLFSIFLFAVFMTIIGII